MTRFILDVDCPRCGADVDYVTGTPLTDKLKREDTTVLRCRQDPHHKWVVHVELLKAPVNAHAEELHRKTEEKRARRSTGKSTGCGTTDPQARKRTMAA